MLRDFLIKNEKEILARTEKKSLDLTGLKPTSEQLKKGLPLFYKQLVRVLGAPVGASLKNEIQREKVSLAASHNDEKEMARAGGHLDEVDLASEAGLHGEELQRLGYTLSHVVHAYGAMCQSITEMAMEEDVVISALSFHELNRCLDVAIAGAVTEYQAQQDKEAKKREVEQLGSLSHELRNALTSVNIAFQVIKKGAIGVGGSTGLVMERGLKRIETLIDRSLTQVRMRVEPKTQIEMVSPAEIADQIIVTAKIEAKIKEQTLDMKIPSTLRVLADRDFFYSALSNVIQNALKYSKTGSTIQLRGLSLSDKVIIEVEDECGGLKSETTDLFKPFEQQNENKKGLGLGLTIARQALQLQGGTIEVENLIGKGCIFRITLPKDLSHSIS